MKDRQTEVNKVYLPYVEKHLGKKPLQNILVTGGTWNSYHVEVKRHSQIEYKTMFSYELIDEYSENSDSITENILYPDNPIESVNLILADIGGGHEVNTFIWNNDTEEGVKKILDSAFIDNHLNKLVFVYFDGMLDLDCFLDKEYDGYKSEDFFSTEISWYDDWNKANFTQRLDGVVFSV